jgi:hypothetical protein
MGLAFSNRDFSWQNSLLLAFSLAGDHFTRAQPSAIMEPPVNEEQRHA